MPRTGREQITDDEKKIIHELQKNSKENIDKIAKKCGFSRQKVWRVIKNKIHTVEYCYFPIALCEVLNCNHCLKLVTIFRL